MRIKGDRVDIAIGRGDLGQDRGYRIVRGVCFDNNWVVGVEMDENRSLRKCGF